MEINARIRIRSDTTDNWESYNPVLSASELVIEKTTLGSLKFKLGDGETNYNSLPYIVFDSIVPTPTTADEGKVLGVSDGQLQYIQSYSVETEENSAGGITYIINSQGV